MKDFLFDLYTFEKPSNTSSVIFIKNHLIFIYLNSHTQIYLISINRSDLRKYNFLKRQSPNITLSPVFTYRVVHDTSKITKPFLPSLLSIKSRINLHNNRIFCQSKWKRWLSQLPKQWKTQRRARNSQIANYRNRQ